MRKLVIGCGYLGRRVAAKWSAAGDEVFALTRSAERAEEFRRQGWQPIVGDVTEKKSLQKKLPEVDVVLHAVGFDRSAGPSQRDVYVEGLKNTLEALTGRVGQWISISSTSVYGQDQGEWIDETSPCQPRKPNGQVCLEAEQLLSRFVPGANILRLAGIYGPGRLLRRLADLKAGKPIAGDPEGWLNLIHVDDAVGAVLACEQRGEPGATYLVCDDRPVRRREYYALLADLAGVELPPFDAGIESHHAEGQGKRCSNRKVCKELGLDLMFPSIQEGLPQAVAGEMFL